MISGSPWINNRLEQAHLDGSRTPWVGPLTDINSVVADPFATLKGMFAWDALFIPEDGAYTDLTETVSAVDTDLVYRWVSQGGLDVRFSQATSGNRPVYTAGSFGDRAGLVFSGSKTMTYPTNVLLTGDYTVFAVVKYVSPGVNAAGPLRWRNADAGDDRVVQIDGVFSGAQQRVYTTPIYDFNPPSSGAVWAFDVRTSGGSVWNGLTQTTGRAYDRTNIDFMEIHEASALGTVTIGAIGYVLNSKLTGGDTDRTAIINELKTLYEV